MNLEPPEPKKQVAPRQIMQDIPDAPSNPQPERASQLDSTRAQPQARQAPAVEQNLPADEQTTEQPMPNQEQDFEETREVPAQKTADSATHSNGIHAEPGHKVNRENAADYLTYSKIKPTDLSSDPMLEKIISVVIANPAYGPSAIRQMLIRLSMADESLTRSDIYRKLDEFDLSTRAKRIAFARANTL